MLSRAMTRRIFMRPFRLGIVMWVGCSFQTDARAKLARPEATSQAMSSDSGNDRLGRQLEPGGEIDVRCVAERVTRGGDVRPRVADVSRARRLEAFLHRLAEDRADRVGDVVHARR